MGSGMNKLFGGGKMQTNFKDLEKFYKLQDEMNKKNKEGIFSSFIWDGDTQRQVANPLLQGGIDSLMGRMGSSSPYEGYSSPSGMNELLQSRMAHQFERMNQQPPQQAPQPGPGDGASIQPVPGPGGPMPPGQAGPMPPGGGPGPMPPGGGPGPMPPGMGGGGPPMGGRPMYPGMGPGGPRMAQGGPPQMGPRGPQQGPPMGDEEKRNIMQALLGGL